MGHAGQLTDGSPGSWVTKCDPLLALLYTNNTITNVLLPFYQ